MPSKRLKRMNTAAHQQLDKSIEANKKLVCKLNELVDRMADVINPPIDTTKKQYTS